MYFRFTIKPSISFLCITSLILIIGITDIIVSQRTDILALGVFSRQAVNTV